MACNQIRMGNGLKDGVNLGNRTNNRIESINDKVKSVLSHHSSLPEFAENILIAFNSLRTERDHKTVNMFQKKPVNAFDRQSEEYKYQELLTPYALTYVLKQMSNRVDVELKEEENEEHEQQWYAESTEGKVLVNSSCCTCTFYKSMLLPCRHMFKLREVKNEGLFQTDGISERWKLETYTKSHRLFSSLPSERLAPQSSVTSTPKRNRKLSQSEKYRKTQVLTQQIASLVSEATGNDYLDKTSTLQNILEMWNDGKGCLVIEVLDMDTPVPTDNPTDTIGDQAEQVIIPVIDTVSDRSENSEVIETERDDNHLEDQILDSDQVSSASALTWFIRYIYY